MGLDEGGSPRQRSVHSTRSLNSRPLVVVTVSRVIGVTTAQVLADTGQSM